MITTRHRTSHAIPLSAKRIGFFSSTGYNGTWKCNKVRFDRLDARNVLEDVYKNRPYQKDKDIEQLEMNNKTSLDKDTIKEKPREHDIIRIENVIPPKIEDVERYCNERKNDVNPSKFMAYYDQKGWKIGKEKMKNWKMAIHTWEHKNFSNNTCKKLSDYSDQELVDELKRRGYAGIIEIKNTISF